MTPSASRMFTGANGALVPRKFGSPAGNRFLFTGREWLKDMRVYDFRARLYQPELGRFLQPDPKQFEAGDYNLYRYCNNAPVNKSDPMGLRSLTMFGGGDWITGSDGLSAWDREVGGMPSNRP
jgi:RHS repeat-associated protein